MGKAGIAISGNCSISVVSASSRGVYRLAKVGAVGLLAATGILAGTVMPTWADPSTTGSVASVPATTAVTASMPSAIQRNAPANAQTPIASHNITVNADGSATASISFNYTCQVPVIGQQAIPMKVTGTAPAVVKPGATFYLTNSQAQMTIPGSAISSATSLLQATAISLTVSQFVLQGTNMTPSQVNVGAAPTGPISAGPIPISGSNPVAIPMPASPISSIGPFTAGQNGVIELSVGPSTADIKFTTPTGTTDLGNTTCVAPTDGTQNLGPITISATGPPTTTTIPGTQPPSTLPMTGSNNFPLVLGGLGSILVGGAVVRSRRRTTRRLHS